MCSDSLFAAGFSAFWHAELEAQKKRIAETPENGDNDEGGVLALPSEQVDENHVAALQSDASAEQDSRVVAEQTQTSEQTDENHVAAQQSGALEEQDSQVVADQAQTSEQADESHVEVQKSEALNTKREKGHDSSKLGNQADDIANLPNKSSNLASDYVKTEVGSYTNYHASGKTYSGKGTRQRSQRSANREAKANNDPHVATDFTPAKNNREAFKDESRRIDANGGKSSDLNYNRIESPGKKYRKQDGEL